MSTETPKYSDDLEREPRHSALEEFSRDERRPAVLLLGALIIAAIFFALGIFVGRWTTRPQSSTDATTNQPRATVPVNASTPAPSPSPSASPAPSRKPSVQPSRNR
jgi:hypothetical protein